MKQVLKLDWQACMFGLAGHKSVSCFQAYYVVMKQFAMLYMVIPGFGA